MNISKIVSTIFITFFVFGISLNSKGQEKSRVTSFIYGGYGDNIFATLYGNVYYSSKRKNQSDTLLPLKDVTITLFDTSNRVFKSIKTDRKGFFKIESRNAIYKIVVKKVYYQTLVISNYTSASDQFSNIEIILELGILQQSYKIADWKND